MIASPAAAASLPAESNLALHEAGALERLFDRLEHVGRLERLEMVVEGPTFGSFDGSLHGPFAGHNDHRQLGMPLLDLLERVQTAHARHADIQNHQIELLGLDALQRRLGTVGRDDFVPLRAEYFLEPGEHVSLVVNYQDSAHGILSGLSGSRQRTSFPAGLMIPARAVRRALP